MIIRRLVWVSVCLARLVPELTNLCGPPLPLLSAEALTNPYAFGRTPHLPVWVEVVFWEIRSVVSKETLL